MTRLTIQYLSKQIHAVSMGYDDVDSTPRTSEIVP